jgi:hypothetical protein
VSTRPARPGPTASPSTGRTAGSSDAGDDPAHGLGDALVAGEMVLRGLLRRRVSVALLALLPLAFYAARHEQVGQSIRFLILGVAWAVSTTAFFASVSARDVERRLCLTGWSRWSLFAGRIGAQLAVGMAMAGGYLLLVALDQPVRSIGGVALDLVTTTFLAVLVGSFVGVVVTRELEGALLLFIVSGLQFMADPPSLLARVLPFWSTREIATYAVDGPDAGIVTHGLLHAGATAAVLLAVTAHLTARRLRVTPPRPAHRNTSSGSEVNPTRRSCVEGA